MEISIASLPGRFRQGDRAEPAQRHVHDQKAMALAQAGRWDAALAACRPSEWGEQPPLILRGRAAWLDAQQFRFDRAIECMREVLSEDPKYY